ncbi:hypothetical protein HDE_00533 [Halotydeus destructor]|nr:hypothetical protein HDE_00533 [Halotydeus destructor]
MLILFLKTVLLVRTVQGIATYVSKCGEPPVIPFSTLVDSGQRLQGSRVTYHCPAYVDKCDYGIPWQCYNDSRWRGRILDHGTPLDSRVVMVNISCSTDEAAFDVDQDSSHNEPYVIYDGQRGPQLSNRNMTCADEVYHWNVQLRDHIVIAFSRLELKPAHGDPSSIKVGQLTVLPMPSDGHKCVPQMVYQDGGRVNAVYWYKCSNLRSVQDRTSNKVTFITRSPYSVTFMKLLLAGPPARCTYPHVAPYARGVYNASQNFTIGSTFEVKCDQSFWTTLEAGNIACHHNGIPTIRYPRCIPNISCPQLMSRDVQYVGSIFSNGQHHIVDSTEAKVKCQDGTTESATCMQGNWNRTVCQRITNVTAARILPLEGATTSTPGSQPIVLTAAIFLFAASVICILTMVRKKPHSYPIEQVPEIYVGQSIYGPAYHIYEEIDIDWEPEMENSC